MPSAQARAFCAGIGLAVSVGCSADEVESDDGDGAAGAVSYEPVLVEGSACGAVLQHRPNEGQTHVAVCSRWALSSAGERPLHTGEVVGSIPTAPTI